jgi:F0F1-type ATP synthase membrane subunit c/vacuolar-type H+-ATPase subunit K
MPVRVYTELNLGAIFFVLWTVFAACFVAAWKLRKSLLTVIRESVHKPTKKLFSNCLFAMPIINSMTLIGVLIIQSIQEMGGIPTGTAPSQGNSFLVLFDRSFASVNEEIGFRLIPIGLFLIFMFMMRKKAWDFSFKQRIKLFFATFLFPDTAKRMVGAKTVEEHGVKGGISLGEWGVVIFTAIIFGLAHYNPGVSWEIGKISSAAFTGLVIGVCYLVYGIQASIIMHWFFNVYSTTYILISDLYPVTTPIVNAIWIITLVLGIAGLVALTNMGIFKLITAIEKRGENRQNQASLSQPVSPL